MRYTTDDLAALFVRVGDGGLGMRTGVGTRAFMAASQRWAGWVWEVGDRGRGYSAAASRQRALVSRAFLVAEEVPVIVGLDVISGCERVT